MEIQLYGLQRKNTKKKNSFCRVFIHQSFLAETALEDELMSEMFFWIII
jgi:hypothetical protein